MNEECHAVYFMVELRKLFDHDRPRGHFPMIRFFANWTVHCRLDEQHPIIGQSFEAMYHSVESTILAVNRARDPTIVSFAAMEALRREVEAFLTAGRLAATLVGDPKIWCSFVDLLTGVLADQPITKPAANVREIRFVPGGHECVITFVAEVGGYHHYQQATS
jgi:hypothetical protein